jgi:hypothetical protein
MSSILASLIALGRHQMPLPDLLMIHLKHPAGKTHMGRGGLDWAADRRRLASWATRPARWRLLLLRSTIPWE